MAVYTTVDSSDLQDLLWRYRLGRLLHCEGIADGIENSNYRIDTDTGAYVLTLIERRRPDELDYFVALMRHLAAQGVPCPELLQDRDGKVLGCLGGRPAILAVRMPGNSIHRPGRAHCAAIGTALGRMHRAGRGFGPRREHDRGLHWWKRAAARVSAALDASGRALLDAEIDFQARHPARGLPCGAIHTDLFRDNALFEGDRLSGLLDFHDACHGALLYDLAVVANDWCSREDGRLDQGRLSALLAAYGRERPFSREESGHWPVMLRAAALRFWLSRLLEQEAGRTGPLVQARDPDEYRRILEARVAGVRELAA